MNRKRLLSAALAAIIIALALLLASCLSGESGQTDTTSTADVPAESSTGESETSPGSSEPEDATSPDSVTDASPDVTSAAPADETGAENSSSAETAPEDTTAEEITTEEITTEEITTEEITTAHVHEFGEWTVTTEPKCETKGVERRLCACGECEEREIPATGHTPVTDKGTPATCTSSGKSDGSHCSVCGKILKAQTVIQPVAHTRVTDPAVQATCTESGLSAGLHCSVCGTVIEAQKVVPALGHTYGEQNTCIRCGKLDPDLGTLLFYENFEKYSNSSNSTTVLSRLGWVLDTPANGAYKGNTASYSIESKNSSKQLYIKNNISDGTDSYVIVVPAALMGKYHESNYTYQFDVTYGDASAADRYIALVSDYSGQVYNSFHFRNRGTANNQVHADGSWYTYDASGVNYAANTNSNSIVNKLLGKTYDSSSMAFKGVSVSIRYVVDWQNGNSVYMRVNTAGYPGTGKWTLVSRYSTSGTAGAFLDPSKFGGAIVLKTGGKQNGWIDNITIWTGTGAEPYDKSSPKFKSTDTGCSGHRFEGGGTCLNPTVCVYCGEEAPENAGHSFVAVGIEGNNDRICDICGVIESNIGSRWKILEIPSFDAGTLSAEVYLAGQGPHDGALPKSSESEMLIASSVTAADLATYLTKLESYGYVSDYSLTRDGNVYAGYAGAGGHVYAYFTNYSKQIRIIYDKTGESIADFGYIYEKQEGERTIVYQYGVPMSVNGYGTDSANNTDQKINCGMMYVVKLADNKLIVIDGGGYQQFDEAEKDGLMAFMREITGKPSGKIEIAAWYITHCHSDHLAGFSLFLKKYASNLTIERLIWNFPSTMSDDNVLSGHKGNYQKLINSYLQKYAGEAKFLKIHTGQSVTLCDFTINCIYTHEDLVDASTGRTKIAADFNNSTTVSRMDFDGLRLMLLGDVNKPGQTVIMNQNSAQTLKSDIVQLAHHMYNNLSLLYAVVQAEAVFAPQSEGGAQRTSTTRAVLSASKVFVTNPDLFKYGASGTYGYAAGTDGKPALVYSKDTVDGGGHTGWSW